MKRLLGLALVLVMLLTMIPAVSLGEAEREIITIRLSSEIPYSFDPEKDAMAKLIVDKFGIIFEDVPYEGDYEKMMLDAQVGDLADVMYSEPLYNLYSFALMIDSDFYKPIPDELLDKYPLIKAQVENSEVAAAVREHFGANYIIPKPDSLDPTIYLGERKGIFIRKDWLEKLGLELPTTWEEFYEVNKAFTLGDPDGDGVNNTYGLTGDTIGNLRYYFSSLGHSNLNWVKKDDGTWTHGALLDDNIEILQWLRKMYDEGLIDPEIGSTNYTQAMQKFASNTFGMVIRNADADWINTIIVKNYWEANKDKGNPFDLIDVIGGLSLDKDVAPNMDAYIDCMCATVISADMSDEALDRYLEFHEWLMENDNELLRLGLEGIDWEHTDDGKVVKILDENGNLPVLEEKYPSLPVFYMPSWGFANAANVDIQTYDNFNDETKALNIEVNKVRNANVVASDMRVKLISAQSMLDANSFKFTAEYWTIVSGSEPVDVMFHDMVSRALADGFEQAIKDVNEITTEKGW